MPMNLAPIDENMEDHLAIMAKIQAYANKELNRIFFNGPYFFQEDEELKEVG